MNIEERNKRSGGYVRFRTIFDYAMGTLYVGGGLMLLFSKRLGLDFQLSATITLIFGGLLVLYGLFRWYRGWKKIF
jgi:hypothetical protein